MFISGWIIVFAVLLFWSVGAYNRLMRLRSAVIQSFGSLDAELLRRAALLDEYDAAVAGPRQPRDAQLHEAFRASATQFLASLSVMRSRPMDAQAAAALVAAGTVQRTAWNSLVEAVRQGGGAPGADGDGSMPFTSLIERCEHMQPPIELATEQFNAAVDVYNRAVTQFPASLLAALFSFRPTRVL